MPEEIAEASELTEKRTRKQLNLLFGIAITLVILMIMLVLAALGFLLYGLLAARLGVSIIGVVACVISFGLLFGLFRLVNKTVRRQAPGQEAIPPAGATTGKQIYAKVQEELSTRYRRAKNGEY